jgi:hypothetical protein
VVCKSLRRKHRPTQYHWLLRILWKRRILKLLPTMKSKMKPKSLLALLLALLLGLHPALLLAPPLALLLARPPALHPDLPRVRPPALLLAPPPARHRDTRPQKSRKKAMKFHLLKRHRLTMNLLLRKHLFQKKKLHQKNLQTMNNFPGVKRLHLKKKLVMKTLLKSNLSLMKRPRR